MADLHIPIPGSGKTLRCRVEGQGPPLVVQAPGWGTGGALFEQTMGPLAEKFTLISYDPRGSGVSTGSWSESELHIGHMANDLHHVVRYLNLDRFSLLGHSHGAWIALLFGTRHPDTLERLVIVGAELDHVEGFEEAQRAFIEQRRVRPAWTAACTAFVDGLETDFSEVRTDADLVRWFRTVLPLYAHDPKTLARAFQGCDMPPLRMAALRATISTNHHFPVLPDAHRVTCPTLVVTGTSEWTGVRMLADRLVEALPQGKALDIEEAGHFPWLERPDVFFEAVEDFLLNTTA